MGPAQAFWLSILPHRILPSRLRLSELFLCLAIGFLCLKTVYRTIGGMTTDG